MILIVGATGRISKAVINQLRSEGLPVRVLAPGLPNPAAFGLDVEVVTRDPASLDEWRAAFDGIEALYCTTPGGPVQLELQSRAVRVGQEVGLGRIVKISNFGAAPDSPLAQARWNWQLETQIRDSGVAHTLLRPRFLMQNFLMVFAPGIRTQGRFLAPAGDGRIPYVDLRDVAEVAVTVLKAPGHEGRTYELTGPEALSCGEIAERFSVALDRPVRFDDLAPEAGAEAFARLGLPPAMARDTATMFVTTGRTEPTSDVTTVTGRPARPLDAFISENLAAFSG